MHNYQQTADGAETYRSVSLFFITTRVLKNKQWIIKDRYSVFEGDAVLLPVLRGLRFVPFEGRATMLEKPIH